MKIGSKIKCPYCWHEWTQSTQFIVKCPLCKAIKIDVNEWNELSEHEVKTGWKAFYSKAIKKVHGK